MAVKKSVQQSHSGRLGNEILVLYGINRLELTADQEKTLEEKLHNALHDVSILVTEKIEWDQEGKSIVVKRPEINHWQDVLQDEFFKYNELLTKNTSRKRNPFQKKLLLAFSIVFFGVLLIIIISPAKDNSEIAGKNQSLSISFHKVLNSIKHFSKGSVKPSQEPKDDFSSIAKNKKHFSEIVSALTMTGREKPSNQPKDATEIVKDFILTKNNSPKLPDEQFFKDEYYKNKVEPFEYSKYFTDLDHFFNVSDPDRKRIKDELNLSQIFSASKQNGSEPRKIISEIKNGLRDVYNLLPGNGDLKPSDNNLIFINSFDFELIEHIKRQYRAIYGEKKFFNNMKFFELSSAYGKLTKEEEENAINDYAEKKTGAHEHEKYIEDIKTKMNKSTQIIKTIIKK